MIKGNFRGIIFSKVTTLLLGITLIMPNAAITKANTLEPITINDSKIDGDINKFTFNGSWRTTNDDNGLYNGDDHFIHIGKGQGDASSLYYTVQFEGNKIEIYGNKAPLLGEYMVSIDDGEEVRVNAYSANKNYQQKIYESDTLENGIHTLKVRGTGEGQGTNANMQVDYVKVYGNEVVSPGIEISPESMKLEVGESKDITVNVLPEGSRKGDILWESDNPNVATIKNGKVTAISDGTANITVTREEGNYIKTCSVTVGTGIAPNRETIIDDSIIGEGIGKFIFNGNWNATTGSDELYNNGDHWITVAKGATNARNIYYTITFEGEKIELYGNKAPLLGKYAISIDGGEEVIVNAYNSTRIVNQKIYESPKLSKGVHTIKVMATGEGQGTSANIQVDYAKVTDNIKDTEANSENYFTKLINKIASFIASIF